MCQELAFCQQCQKADIKAWAAGTTHQPPMSFGDSAQKYAAVNIRLQTMSRLIRLDDLSSLQRFPEWRSVLGKLKIASVTQLNDVLKAVPYTVPPPPRGANNRRKRKFRKYLRNWNAPLGGSYEELKTRLYWEINSTLSIPRVQAMAA